MAHFAELETVTDYINDETCQVVRNVLVVANEDCLDENGDESEAVGIAFLDNLFPGKTWKQTSYNDNFRKRYAQIDGTYDPDLDMFIPKQEWPSWHIGSNHDWEPPIRLPDDAKHYIGANGKMYYWDESVYQNDNANGWIIQEEEE